MSEDKKCGVFGKFLCLAQCKLYIAENWMLPLMLVIMRVYTGNVFWKSGLTKYNSADSGTQLFEWEYIPNWEKNSQDVLGFDLSWTTPSAEFAAKMATFGELFFPVLLVVGLGGRFAAFALFCMALTIDTFVYTDPKYIEHDYWLMVFGLLTLTGPGRISIDHLIRKKLLGQKEKTCG